MPETLLPSETSSPNREVSVALQWFREIITAGISVVVLVLAATMLFGTWQFARTIPAGTDITAHKDAYDRQKDIMLYALALLGTVTGYYLGRVPAELHAQQAQRAATSAQEQLQTTQSQLTDAASTAAVAVSQASTAQSEKQQALEKVENAKSALEGASTTISDAIAGIAQPVGSPSGSPESFDVGSSAGKIAPARTDLMRAKSEIDRALLQLRSVGNTR
jgi:type II secretory pathway component PulM